MKTKPSVPAEEYVKGNLTEAERGDLRFLPKPVVAEYKHGSDSITLVPPSGVPSKADAEAVDLMAACGKREFEEETGIKLAEVSHLSPRGLAISTRRNTQRYFPLLGKVAEPILLDPSKLDRTEFLKMVLFSLDEWVKLVENGNVEDDCAVSITYLALRKLGKLR